MITLATFFVGQTVMFGGVEVLVKGETDSGSLLIVKDGKEVWTTYDKVLPIYAIAA